MLNPKYTETPKKRALIFDLDGVLVDSSFRFKRLDLEAIKNKDTKAFVKSIHWYNSDCDGDSIIETGAQFLWSLCNYYHPEKVFFITARGQGGYEPTLRFLKERNIFGPDHWQNELIMNPEDLDNFDFERLDHAAWKGSVAKELMNEYNILLAVDDGEQNCQEFFKLGIPVLKFMMPGLGKVLI